MNLNFYLNHWVGQDEPIRATFLPFKGCTGLALGFPEFRECLIAWYWADFIGKGFLYTNQSTVYVQGGAVVDPL